MKAVKLENVDEYYSKQLDLEKFEDDIKLLEQYIKSDLPDAEIDLCLYIEEKRDENKCCKLESLELYLKSQTVHRVLFKKFQDDIKRQIKVLKKEIADLEICI